MFIFANIYKIPENSKSFAIINIKYDDKNLLLLTFFHIFATIHDFMEKFQL